MASTPTTNYGWAKPGVGSDADVWGGEINADLDGIDATVKSVSNAIPAASSTTPVMDGTAVVGTGTTFARADHVHPTDTSRYAASNPSGYQTAAQVTAVVPAASSITPTMDGTAAVGTGTTFARADHVHPNDTSRVAKAGDTMTGALTLSSSAPLFVLDGPAGSYRSFIGRTSGLNRWAMSVGTGDAETGSNVGSDFKFDAFDDSGAYLSTPWLINRRFGYVTFGGSVFLNHDPVQSLESATKQYVDSGRLGDNRIINGDMRIDQRNSGASGTAVGYTVDRWQFNGSLATKGSWQRILTGSALSEFQYALKFTSNSAYASLAGDYFAFVQAIEADTVGDFMWGTSNARTVTLSFWAASSLTGTFSGCIGNYAGTRSYPFTYSLPSANTWAKITVTIPGDTAGTWVMTGNAGALFVIFDFGSGSTYRGAAGAWASAQYMGATGSVSVVGTNAATFYVTGCKLETGGVATPYNRPSLAKSLADCQRYYLAMNQTFVSGYNAAGQPAYTSFAFPVTMRTTPTAAFSGTTYSNASAIAASGVGSATNTTLQVTVTATGMGWGQTAATFNAEL